MIGLASLWTGAQRFRIERGPLLIATLSTILASRAFPTTRFVTDRRGAQLAEAFGWPFDEVTMELEALPPELSHIWSLGKLAANALQRTAFAQFDLDVLLFQKLPDRLLNAPLFAQSPDTPAFYRQPDMVRARLRAGLPGGAKAFNTGLIGGVDSSALAAYAGHAVSEIAPRFAGSALDGTVISMTVEQYWLGVFSAQHQRPVQTLLPANPSKAAAAALGYVHLIGPAKRDPRHLAKGERRLQTDFPRAHRRFCEAWRALSVHAPCTLPSPTVYAA